MKTLILVLVAFALGAIAATTWPLEDPGLAFLRALGFGAVGVVVAMLYEVLAEIRDAVRRK